MRLIIMMAVFNTFFLIGPMGLQFLVTGVEASYSFKVIEANAAEEYVAEEGSTDQAVIDKEKELMGENRGQDYLLGVIDDIGDGFITIDDQAYSLPPTVLYRLKTGGTTGRSTFLKGNMVEFLFAAESVSIIELRMKSSESVERGPIKKSVVGDTLKFKDGVWTN